MIRCNWNVEIEGQQHKIELQIDTILRFFGTGSGRLLVDGETVRDWSCNPLRVRVIPKGLLEFEVAGRRAFIRSRVTMTNYAVLVLGGQEIPPMITKT